MTLPLTFPPSGFSVSAAPGEAEEELTRGGSEVEREVEEELAPDGVAVGREVEEELAPGGVRVKREAEEELTEKNSAPTSLPLRHFTRARRRPLLFFDKIKVNVLGRL